jgi:hypothetical protein
MSGRKIDHIRQTTAKGILLLLVSAYLLFSIGIIKATHFCMGREASVAFFSSQAKKCPCSIYASASEKNSCCDDSHELLRLEDEQKVISNFSLAIPRWFVLEKLYTIQLVADVQSEELLKADWTAEHLPPKVPLWKTNCSLLFYDDELIA